MLSMAVGGMTKSPGSGDDRMRVVMDLMCLLLGLVMM